MKDDRTYLGHILDAIEKIERYLHGTTLETFEKDDKTYDAVMRQCMILGEAANNLSQELKEGHTDVPWHKVRGLRNKLIHDYMRIDADVIWQTCQSDLPPLKKNIKAILEQIVAQ